MRISRLVIIAVVLSLVVAACSSTTTTTTTPPTTTTPTATTTTSAPIDLGGFEQPDWTCNYLVGTEDQDFNELVAVSETNPNDGFTVTEAAAELTAGGIPASEVDMEVVL